MAEKIDFIPQQPFVPIAEPSKVARRGTGTDGVLPKNTVGFDNLLAQEITQQNKIKFSGHAQQRLQMRNIQFTPNQLERMANAVERAAAKGARDSLLMVDNIAAVVSVENRTVVTVAQGDSLRDNVFTNIDSAVIA
jgi:flagellar operon protein